MRATFVTVALLAIGTDVAMAQTYKCQNGGRVYTANYPCPGYEYVEPKKPAYTPPERVEYEAQPTPTQSSAESPVVRQSNAMIAAALAEGDFAKAERLAVTREQWEMIGAARRIYRMEQAEAASRAEASKRADEQAKANARAEARARKPTVCTSNSYIQGSADRLGSSAMVRGTTNTTTVCR